MKGFSVTLIYARNIHLGEQKPNGEYVTVHDDATVCEPCVIEKQWGFTTYIDDVPGEKCVLCGSTD